MKAVRYYEGLEVRSSGQSSRVVEGYALKFNTYSQDLGGFVEVIDPRALDETDLSDVVALFNHDTNLLLARTASSTLQLSVDSIGLRYTFEAPNTTAGNDLLESIKRGDITGSSFAFVLASPNGDSWEQKGGVYIRTLLKISKIIDISPVVFPAYKSTDVYKRYLENCEAEFRSASNHQNITFNNMKKPFSLLESVRQLITGTVASDTKKIIERGKKIASEFDIPVSGQLILPLESRALQATDATGLIKTDVVFDFAQAFRNTNVLVKAGAKYITEMQPNFRVPRQNGVSVNWATENEQAQEGSNTLGAAIFSPKRLTAKITVSKQLLLQTNGQAEKMLFDDIISAVNNKVESTVLGSHAHDDAIPDGLFTGKTDTDFVIKGTGINRHWLLDMEYSLQNTGRDSRAFIVNEKGSKFLKLVPKATGATSYLLEDDKINGQPVLITDNIPGSLLAGENEEGIIYGNWSELLVAQFGVLDIVVDPYSQAHSNSVVITINAFFDMKPRNPNAFAVGSMLIS